MISQIVLQESYKILIVLIIVSAALIVAIRDLLFMNYLYRIQSLLIVFISIGLYASEKNLQLIAIAAITLLGKVIIIPNIIKKVQVNLKIKRDSDFHFLTPIGSIFASTVVFLVVYSAFSRIIGDMPNELLLIMGSLSVSLIFMGLIIMFTRQQTITNIIGYLTMENGVLLFSLFIAELPLIIEILIILDLLMITALSTLFAFGIDYNMDEFHEKLNPISNLFGGKK